MYRTQSKTLPKIIKPLMLSINIRLKRRNMNYYLSPINLFLTSILIFCSSVELFSQFEPIMEEKFNSSSNRNEIKNPYHTECIAYRMEKGDTALYRVITSDSIVVFGEPTLFRQRIEQYTVKCNNATGDRINYSQRLTDYVSMESRGSVMDVKNTEHPWSSVWVEVEIDTMGNRYTASISDSSKPRQAPGGGFQPLLFPTLDFSCRYIGEKWTFKNSVVVPENGYPSPKWDEHIFYAMMPPLDTLGVTTQKLELNKTALCYLDVELDKSSSMNVVNSKNSFGFLYFSKDIPMPLLQKTTSENKMKIYGISKDPRITHHFIDTKIILEKYVDSDNKIIYEHTP